MASQQTIAALEAKVERLETAIRRVFALRVNYAAGDDILRAALEAKAETPTDERNTDG